MHYKVRPGNLKGVWYFEGPGFGVNMTYTGPEEEAKKIVEMLNHAFDCGESAKAAEFRRALGIGIGGTFF